MEEEIFEKSQGSDQEVDAGDLELWMLPNATVNTESRPLPMVSPTVLEEIWVQAGFYSPPASGAWGEHQSTTDTAPEVGLGGTEGVISEPENGAEVGIG